VLGRAVGADGSSLPHCSDFSHTFGAIGLHLDDPDAFLAALSLSTPE